LPELDCGITGKIGSVPLPPISFSVTGPLSEELIRLALQEKIAVSSVGVRFVGMLPPGRYE
jgi:hypothetical protein